MDARRGFALAATLMILALLSVLGAAAVQSLTVETRISAHDRDARVALYLAGTALGEARYYASRGWGKIRGLGGGQAVVETPLPPGLRWEADSYAGFTLYDRRGRAFPVLAHTGGAPPVLTLAAGADAPADGRFTLVRHVPDTAVWAAPHLTVDDDAWAARSPLDAWAGWTLWNAEGQAVRVTASSTAPAALGAGLAVRLTLTGDPGAGPFRLAHHPWLRDLAAGAALPGDEDPAADGWSRAFDLPPRHEVGSATVAAVVEGPGRYALTAVGVWGASLRAVRLRVTGAGLPEQHAADWAVVTP